MFTYTRGIWKVLHIRAVYKSGASLHSIDLYQWLNISVLVVNTLSKSWIPYKDSCYDGLFEYTVDTLENLVFDVMATIKSPSTICFLDNIIQ